MPRYVIPNLERACRVLKLLGDHPGGLSLAEVSRRLRIPRTTALRIVATLSREDLLVRREGRYAPGPGLIPLGMSCLNDLDLRNSARPAVQALAEKTGETAHLAVLSRDRALLVEVVQSPNPIRVGAPPGTLVDLHCSATGKVLLAFACPGDVGSLPLRRRTTKTLTRADEFRVELARIRRQGYAVDDEEYYAGVRCIAAPVRDARGGIVAALGVTATTGRFTLRLVPAWARLVVAQASSLSSALGYGGR